MTAEIEKVYQQTRRLVHEASILGSALAVLGWDERTYMPKMGGAYRAEQIRVLSGMLHERATDPKLGENLEKLTQSELAADRESDTGATVYWLKREYDKRVKLPKRLVEELAETAVLGQQAWVTARAENNFETFRPLLEKTLDLKREEADALGWEECRYDALLDDYEPEAKTAEVAEVLAGLRDALVPLVSAIAASEKRPRSEILSRRYPIEDQKKLGFTVSETIGFDFSRGRIDTTDHPFCTGLGPKDCRITTRYDEHHFSGAFFGTMHESGHGIYDQGLPEAEYGLPLGSAISLGIHESQSRMWENCVGRSAAFWEFFYPKVRELFSTSLADVSRDDFYFAINEVKPSLIRVEADEVTYNLHILIRFELERALLDGDLPVPDAPGAWNEKYRTYLGIEPPSDAEGVLQDVHWSAGLFGYFPTYALGNLYASQFIARAAADLGDLDSHFRSGEFTPLRDWLRENIHRHGRRYSASALVQRVTGKPLSHAPLIDYLKAKLGPLYGLDR